MIKAIIFDCFGVLTTDLWLEFKKKHFSDKPDLEQQATDLNKQTDRGFIAYDDFIDQVAALAKILPSETKLQIEGNVSNKQLFEYIQDKLKPNYKIGMLSNAASNWLSEIFTPDQLKLFDDVVLSYTTGFIKPQPEIYKLITEKLGVLPEECVFVDDREGYCTAAEDLGMGAIFYQHFGQFKENLEELLADSNN